VDEKIPRYIWSPWPISSTTGVMVAIFVSFFFFFFLGFFFFFMFSLGKLAFVLLFFVFLHDVGIRLLFSFIAQ